MLHILFTAYLSLLVELFSEKILENKKKLDPLSIK